MESQAGMENLQGDGFELAQKNQKAHPQNAQGAADCANRGELHVGS